MLNVLLGLSSRTFSFSYGNIALLCSCAIATLTALLALDVQKGKLLSTGMVETNTRTNAQEFGAGYIGFLFLFMVQCKEICFAKCFNIILAKDCQKRQTKNKFT